METKMYQFGDSLSLIVDITRVENVTYKEGHIKFWMYGGQELSAYYEDLDLYEKELRLLYKIMNVQVVEEMDEDELEE